MTNIIFTHTNYLIQKVACILWAVLALSFMTMTTASAEISKHSNGTILVTEGNAYFSIWNYQRRPGKPPMYGIKAEDRTVGLFNKSGPPIKCSSVIDVKFDYDFSLLSIPTNFNKDTVLTADDFQGHDFLKAYREAFSYVCEDMEKITFEIAFRLPYPETTSLIYKSKAEKASNWRLTEGADAGYSAEKLVSFSYRSPDYTVDANVNAKCSDEPVIGLTRVQQTTMTKMPTLANYEESAPLVAEAYFNTCDKAEFVHLTLSPLPDDYACGKDEVCRFTIQKSALNVVDKGNIKYLRGARKGIPPGGFRYKSDAEIALEANGQFKNYRAGTYLSAIYAGEFDVAKTHDKLFVQPYVQMMGGSDMAALTLFFKQGFDVTESEIADVQKDMENYYSQMSMIDLAMATYLFSYPNIYSQCMEPNAPSITVTTDWQEVTTQGGFELHRGPVQTTVETFEANRKFYPILKKVVGTEPRLAGFVDTIFRQSPVYSIADTNAGIYAIMDDYRCDSPEIKQLETNLVKYWEDYHRRISPLREKVEANYK